MYPLLIGLKQCHPWKRDSPYQGFQNQTPACVVSVLHTIKHDIVNFRFAESTVSD